MKLTWIGGEKFCTDCMRIVKSKLVSPAMWKCMDCGGSNLKEVLNTKPKEARKCTSKTDWPD